MTTVVCRISKSRYRDKVFSGLGGIYAYGRWTPRGIPVVYTSQSISLAVLEYTLNYKRHGWLPPSVLARANIPDEVDVESISISQLPDNWQDPDPPAALREIGQKWLRRAETARLKVPSAIVPEESNYLLNPGIRTSRSSPLARPNPSTLIAGSAAHEDTLEQPCRRCREYLRKRQIVASVAKQSVLEWLAARSQDVQTLDRQSDGNVRVTTAVHPQTGNRELPERVGRIGGDELVAIRIGPNVLPHLGGSCRCASA